MKQSEHNKIIASIEEKNKKEINELRQNYNEEISELRQKCDVEINQIKEEYSSKIRNQFELFGKASNENYKETFLKGMTEGAKHTQLAISRGFINLIERLHAEGVDELNELVERKNTDSD